MNAEQLSLEGFGAALASSQPAPGGGGAAALVGSVAAALVSMVGNLTVGKPKYAAFEADLEKITAAAERLRKQLLAGIDRDAEAFLPLSRAYGLPRDTENREKILEEALINAAQAPLAVMELCRDTAVLLREIAGKGSKLVLSDVICGAWFAEAALQASLINVKINTGSMHRAENRTELEARAEALLQEGLALCAGARAEAAQRL